MSELSGIIRNGIERGWPNEEIKNSLLNAGYSLQEIDYELSQLLKTTPIQQLTAPIIPSAINQSQNLSPVNIPNKIESDKKFNSQDLTNYQTPPVEKKASNWIVIAIITLLVLCVLAGAGLFLFG
jgi:hypothetical protein